ncbi:MULTISPECIES: MBL fold metallo-hydrolase [Parabacteroides]|uniref:MBL fold metallo-hydrolase n=1 Tax=Parabacteroides provencensis TaxID=1944636 RepID=UPI000C1597FA|nr:MBL fold metallo-hydrolase [Parabacteroides provencensis]
MISIKAFEVNYFSENTYLLYDETKEAVLIDCGCIRRNEEKEISDFVAQNGLTIKRYLCTHLHLDHIFGNMFVYKTYGLKPEAHKADVEGLPSSEEQAKQFGLPAGIQDVPVEKYLVGGEIIKFGKSELQVITVPGHSPGSVCFYNSKNGFIIAGDALFSGSIGRTDLWGGNQDVLIAAIKNKLLTLPDETVVYPGHGTETTIINEKLNNPYL